MALNRGMRDDILAEQHPAPPPVLPPAGTTAAGLQSAFLPFNTPRVPLSLDQQARLDDAHQQEVAARQAGRDTGGLYETTFAQVQRENEVAQHRASRNFYFKGVDPFADETLRRLSVLSNSGQGWLDEQTALQFASSKFSDRDMLSMVETMRQIAAGEKAVTKGPNGSLALVAGGQQGATVAGAVPWRTIAASLAGVKSIYHDPVLEKDPNASTQLRAFLVRTIGLPPIAETDLAKTQANLQKLGYGGDLTTDGVWNRGWQDAMYQYKQAVVASQLAGEQPGSTTAGSALHWLTAVLPKESLEAIVGFAKASGPLLRQLTADLAMGATNIVGSPAALFPGVDVGEVAHVGGTVGGFVAGKTPEKFLGQYVGAEGGTFDPRSQTYKDVGLTRGEAGGHIAGRTLDDVNTLFLTVSAIGAAGKLSASVANAWAGGLDAAAAVRGPGVITKTLFRMAPEELADGGTAWRAFADTPVLRRAGPWVDRLANGDGMYYRFRSRAAMPYRLPPVRAAGAALTETGLFGAQVRGQAAISGMLNPSSPLAAAVQGEHFLDPLDERVKAWEQHLPGPLKHLSNGIDDLAFLLHAPISHGAEGAASASVKKSVDELVDTWDRAYEHVGPQIERGIQIGTGKFPNVAELQDAAGGPDRWRLFWSHKVREHAAAFYAENRIAAEDALVPVADRSAVTREEWVQRMQQYEHEAMGDPAVIKKSLTQMLAQPGDELAVRIGKEINSTRLSPVAYMEGEVGRLLDASKIVREEVVPHSAGLLGPASKGPLAPESIGIANLDTPTRQSVAQQVRDWRKQLAVKDLTTADAISIDGDVRQFMFEHAGWDRRNLEKFDTTDKLLGAVDEWGKGRSWEVYPSLARDAAVRPAIDKLNALGKKLVVGTDIGWLHVDLPVIDKLDEGLNPVRRRLEDLGLSPRMMSNESVATTRWLSIRRTIQDQVDAGKVTLPPYHTVDTIMADLRSEKVINPELTGVERAVAAVTLRPKKIAPYVREVQADEKFAEASLGQVTAEARRRAEQDILGYLQLRDIPRSKVIDALTRQVDLGEELGVPLMDKASADRLYRAIVKGSAEVPAYMLGISRVEDMWRASMGWAGEAIPGEIGERVANLPNRLAKLRNDYRFTLSPQFSVRRIIKTNAKLILEGVEPTLNPLKAMGARADHSWATLKRVAPRFGNKASEAADDAERFLQQSDIWTLYNHGQYEAYAAGRWADMGKTDDQIRRLLVKTFGYGKDGIAGRSALERSVNTVWFPFSFDKTLYRNFGGYLLDHPGQLVVLDRGLRAYDEFSKQMERDGTDDWRDWFTLKGLESHVPVVEEALRLNAFAHGVSLGEFGGINAPFLNMFLPQSWASSDATTKALQRFVPALKDLSRVSGELNEQLRVLRSPSHLTTSAEREKAFAYREELRTQLEKELDWNARHQKPEQKYTFSDGMFKGDAISSEKLNLLVADKFPSWSAAKMVEAATSKRDSVVLFGAKNPQYKEFVGWVLKWADYLKRGDVKADQVVETAKGIGEIRDYAAYWAQRDSKFYRWYQSNLASSFGPLERVKAR